MIGESDIKNIDDELIVIVVQECQPSDEIPVLIRFVKRNYEEKFGPFRGSLVKYFRKHQEEFEFVNRGKAGDHEVRLKRHKDDILFPYEPEETYSSEKKSKKETTEENPDIPEKSSKCLEKKEFNKEERKMVLNQFDITGSLIFKQMEEMKKLKELFSNFSDGMNSLLIEQHKEISISNLGSDRISELEETIESLRKFSSRNEKSLKKKHSSAISKLKENNRKEMRTQFTKFTEEVKNLKIKWVEKLKSKDEEIKNLKSRILILENHPEKQAETNIPEEPEEKEIDPFDDMFSGWDMVCETVEKKIASTSSSAEKRKSFPQKSNLLNQEELPRRNTVASLDSKKKNLDLRKKIMEADEKNQSIEKEEIEETYTGPLKTVSDLSEKNQTKVNNILREILGTESAYVQDLNKVIVFYVNPLKSQNINIQNPKIHGGFAKLGIIKNINTIFLKDLESVISLETSNISTQRIDKFSRTVFGFSQTFKLYSDYISSYGEFSDLISKCKKKNKRFEKYLKTQQKELEKEKSRITDLYGFLIIPIQRIPRYQLMMRDLLKIVTKEYHEFQELSKAEEIIRDMAKYANDKTLEIKNLKRLEEIEKKIKVHQIVLPHRKLICEQEVKLLKFKKKDHFLVESNCVLLSDVLLLYNLKNVKENSFIELKKDCNLLKLLIVEKYEIMENMKEEMDDISSLSEEEEEEEENNDENKIEKKSEDEDEDVVFSSDDESEEKKKKNDEIEERRKKLISKDSEQVSMMKKGESDLEGGMMEPSIIHNTESSKEVIEEQKINEEEVVDNNNDNDNTPQDIEKPNSLETVDRKRHKIPYFQLQIEYASTHGKKKKKNKNHVVSICFEDRGELEELYKIIMDQIDFVEEHRKRLI